MKNLDKAILAQFMGGDEFYRHNIMRSICYTEGVRYVAEEGGAYWLIDKIATSQLDPKIAREEFQVWKLAVTGSTATLTCDDGDGNIVHAEHITYTDFPLSEIELWFTNQMILLPSEN